MPAKSAPICDPDHARLFDIQRVETPSGLAVALRLRVRGEERAHRGSTARTLADEEDDAVDGEEDRSRERLREHRAQRVLERETGQPGGERGRDEEPRQSFVGRLEASRPERAKERADDAHPLVAEVERQRDRRRGVQC